MEKFNLVRLKRPGFGEYVCWIPNKLLTEALEKKKPIKLYHSDINEWRENYEIITYDPNPVTKEEAESLYTKRKEFLKIERAGRSSYKD